MLYMFEFEKTTIKSTSEYLNPIIHESNKSQSLLPGFQLKIAVAVKVIDVDIGLCLLLGKPGPIGIFFLLLEVNLAQVLVIFLKIGRMGIGPAQQFDDFIDLTLFVVHS